MLVEIANSDDLAALYVAYIELVDRGRETLLDIHVAPGVYGVASIGPIQLDLGGNPAPRDPKIDIVVRGDPGSRPAVFRDLGMLVQARSLRLENLILTGRHQCLLEARIARSLEIKHCVVADNSWDPSWSGALVRAGGLPGMPAFTVDIEDTWFLRNGEQSPAALLAIGPATGSFVERVALRGVHFVGNTTRSDLLVHEAREVYASDLVVSKAHQSDAVFLRHDRCGRVVIEHSTFVLDDPVALAAEDTRTWSSGLELARSKVYVPDISRTLLPNVRGNFEVLDGASFAACATALDSVVTAVALGVSRGAAARAMLRDAVSL